MHLSKNFRVLLNSKLAFELSKHANYHQSHLGVDPEVKYEKN